jgi:hypothetical protein
MLVQAHDKALYHSAASGRPLMSWKDLGNEWWTDVKNAAAGARRDLGHGLGDVQQH